VPDRYDIDITASHAQPTSPSTAAAIRAANGNRFEPGTVLQDRYRIVAMLGKGGMGEVYRADDLKLASSVALKLLPETLAFDPVRLDRFRSEVRLTRQISHANVCRVYDIGDFQTAAGPAVFLSMEYVDGEDLGSLLRRIGRLPEDKALQIARQICAGLHAAHEQGVIHRDLKPANIMLDGRGNARIMDFGVAGFADDLNAKGDIASGTPAYMAPEQFNRTEVSRKSDLFSLGLVLYELFTGKPAFNAQSIEELRTLHKSGTSSSLVTSPTSIVRGLDPAVERVILHCLENDPRNRPNSALAVSAALPGGDPLAAALAAGETPSPELLAHSPAARARSPSGWRGRSPRPRYSPWRRSPECKTPSASTASRRSHIPRPCWS
jgi:serine/threonine protein kinase